MIRYRAEGFVVATGERDGSGIGRPAALYRRGPARLLQPPLLRSPDLAEPRLGSPGLR
ncbi:hypothetical protein [Actinocorallia herbida]|uniref:hypothetical protein n=1 Tax=Actinocorallia herbida TaxID=58109 RepID=UPI001476E980|nr:hypothetical protein [Actinocorallia herbida]